MVWEQSSKEKSGQSPETLLRPRGSFRATIDITHCVRERATTTS